jgi:hypothetical protein
MKNTASAVKFAQFGFTGTAIRVDEAKSEECLPVKAKGISPEKFAQPLLAHLVCLSKLIPLRRSGLMDPETTMERTLDCTARRGRRIGQSVLPTW